MSQVGGPGFDFGLKDNKFENVFLLFKLRSRFKFSNAILRSMSLSFTTTGGAPAEIVKNQSS